MLNIYQGFFSNIGPLKNKSVLVNYKQGKILIKAPIGTGKSFLFFDGPIYALYKSADRTIINKDSKKGEIQLLFSVNNNYFLIIRKLSLTKSGGDSAKTYFYSILKDKNFIDYLEQYKNENIILKNNDILTLLNFYQIKYEDLTTQFKQEKELQENLNDLLPPKEVALSTIFLPQNSENIFELTPSARINILKQVFGILGIDDAKKIIDEKRKEIAGMLKAKEETSSYKDKLDSIFKNILEKRKNIENYNFGQLDEFIANFEQLDENLFDVNLDKTSQIEVDFDSILKTHKNKQEDLLKNKEQKKHIEKLILEKQSERLDLENKIKKLNQEINLFEENEQKQKGLKLEIKAQKSKIEQIVQKQNLLKSKYTNLQSEYEDFLNFKNSILSIKKENEKIENEIKKIDMFLEKIKKEQTKQSLSVDKTKLEKLQKELEEKKQIDFNFFTFNEQKVSSIDELSNLFSVIENEGKNIKQEIEKEEKNLESLEKELQNLIKNSEKTTKKIDFHCEKINTNCPFIEKIGAKLLKDNNFIEQEIKNKKEKINQTKQTIKQLLEKRNLLASYWKEKNVSSVRKQIEQIKTLEKDYNNMLLQIQKEQEQQNKLAKIQGQVEEKKHQKEQLLLNLEENKQKLKKLQKELEEKKQIEQDYKLYNTFNTNLEQQNNILLKLNEELDKLKDKENTIKTLQGEINQIQKQLENVEKELEKLNKEKEKLDENVKNDDLEKLKVEEKNILDLKEQVFALNNLILDYQKNKLTVINLKQKLTLYKDLSNIFGKELVIYVFSDYIENLQALINYFIQDIVNFKLFIQLDEKGENLDIFVEDEKGKRDVKSLSGGQKTALRIGWILGISRLQNSKVLFLDETINNFDQESVQVIANKIKEFVEEKDMKFYMITHSDILQQAPIWSEVLELKL